MANYTRLNKVNNIGDSTISTIIQDNLVEFFDWGMLDAGGFSNVDIPSSGFYGDNRHKLRSVKDPNYTDGQVWEGFRSNWVWQSGLSCTQQPNTMTVLRRNPSAPASTRSLPGVSGVFVGNVFQPTSGVGSYQHHIDYPRGRVIFDSAISTSSEVKAEYSYKEINVVRANSDFFREIQYDTLDGAEGFNFAGSGSYSQLAGNRLQLPAVAVEVLSGRDLDPYALGGQHYINTDVLFHVLAEDDYSRDQLLDIISLQDEKSIYLFDSDRIGRSGVFPLDYRGSTTSTDKDGNFVNSLMYPTLVDSSGNGGYRYGGIQEGMLTFKNAKVQKSDSFGPNLYHGVVRLTTEVIS